ncbi:hypothetical protein JCM33374_g1062 [Metschnikowia sp. JCM 33374]|nr:hypothetical protein JCM33374_g1062 [Metschnikowia sp. JCM 33374]
MHEDWFPYQLCKVGGTHAPKYHDDNCRDSRIYTWESQPGDILIVVSGGVREVLQYNQIQYAFMSANQREKDGEHVMASAHEKLSSSAEDFSFVAMDIVQAAKRASGEGRNTDMMAIAMVVE